MTSTATDVADRVDDGAAQNAPTHSVAHGTFHLERVYDASRARVWQAFTDPAAKSRWFGTESDQVEIMERTLDVCPGGRERLAGKWGGKVLSTFDATYYDVIENERLVYCYEMHMDGRKISVSTATVELKAEGACTKVLVTEQGAFLDGYDDAGAREQGTGLLLDALGRSLKD